MTPEPFVSVEEAVKFLPLSRRRLLALARKGIAGAYAIDIHARRKTWVFRLSELTATIEKINTENRIYLARNQDRIRSAVSRA